MCADSYLGIREIISRNEEVMHSNTENITEDRLDIEINDFSLTQLLDSEYGVIERENTKTPRKSSFCENNIDAVHVHKSNKHTLGNIEVTPNNLSLIHI